MSRTPEYMIPQPRKVLPPVAERLATSLYQTWYENSHTANGNRWENRETVIVETHRSVASFLGNARNPYASFVDFAESIPEDWASPNSDTLLNCVWRAFAKWISNKNEVRARIWELVSSELATRAARLALKQRYKSLAICVNIFQFDSQFRSEAMTVLEEELRYRISLRGELHLVLLLLRAAPYLVNHMEDHALQKLVLFCFCNPAELGHLYCMLKIIDAAKLSKLMSFLDSLVGSPSQTAFAVRVKQLDDTFSNLQLRDALNYTRKLAKESNAGISLPKVSVVQNQKFLMHILMNTFGFGAEIDMKTFRELVRQIVNSHPELKKDVVETLHRQGHSNAGDFWAIEFGLKDLVRYPNRIPNDLEDLLHLDMRQFHCLPETVHTLFVQTVDDYRMVFEDYLRGVSEIGIDAEWPGTNFAESQKISIVQIATRDQIFVIDFWKLADELDRNDWQLFESLLSNCNVKKITFGFSSDMSMFQSSFAEKGWRTSSLASHLDLSVVSKNVWSALQSRKVQTVTVRSEKTTREVVLGLGIPPLNLSDLCKLILGKPLSKLYRMSNWTRRPLDKEQLNYAAIDAYCLIELFDAFSAMVQQYGLDMSSLTVSKITQPVGNNLTNNENSGKLVVRTVDSISRLNQIRQLRSGEVSWDVTQLESQFVHLPTFRAVCHLVCPIGGLSVDGVGEGSSKQAARQAAAANLLGKMDSQESLPVAGTNSKAVKVAVPIATAANSQKSGFEQWAAQCAAGKVEDSASQYRSSSQWEDNDEVAALPTVSAETSQTPDFEDWGASCAAENVKIPVSFDSQKTASASGYRNSQWDYDDDSDDDDESEYSDDY